MLIGRMCAEYETCFRECLCVLSTLLIHLPIFLFGLTTQENTTLSQTLSPQKKHNRDTSNNWRLLHRETAEERRAAVIIAFISSPQLSHRCLHRTV